MSADTAKRLNFFWRRTLLLVLLLLLAVPAWPQDNIELPQADGGMLQLSKPATRIITLSPNLAELVFAAGAGDKLLATVEYSDYPAEVLALPRLGNAFRIDIERVHQFDPDLILAWESGNPASALSQLEDLGFKVWHIEIRQPEEIAEIVSLIGQATQTEKTASLAATEIRQKINTLKEQYSQAKKISYFYQVAAEPLYTVNGDHLISRGLFLCGGQNVFADLPTLAPQIGYESVILADPVVFIGPDIANQPNPLDHWRSWPRLRAVHNNNFLLLPADPISRATPRFIDAISQACNMMNELR